MFNLFKRTKAEPEETRSVPNGYTAQIMALRENWINGHTGVGELTATVQGAVSLWENSLAASDVQGTDMLPRSVMAAVGRSLALRGESLWYISEDGLLPVSDYDMTTRDGKPRAYRLTIPDAGGGRTVNALAAEVLHFRIGVDSSAPWTGTSPLRRSSLTAGLLETIETVLAETYGNAPIGSAVVPFPESPGTDLETLSRGFKGRRGGILLRESTNVAAAGGTAPAQDWKGQDLTPDLERAMLPQTLDRARGAILNAFGVLPALVDPATTGQQTREAQRHLAVYTVQPMAQLIAEEASNKLGSPVAIDVLGPLQAYDAGLRARAFTTLVQGLAMAKEAGIEHETALKLVNWGADDDRY